MEAFAVRSYEREVGGESVDVMCIYDEDNQDLWMPRPSHVTVWYHIE